MRGGAAQRGGGAKGAFRGCGRGWSNYVCAEYGLAEPSFYAWRRIVAQRDQESAQVRAKPEQGSVHRAGPASDDAPVFVPLRVIDVSTQVAIGSGITEAACKTLFTQRFKQSGMKWSLEGGQVVVNLRVVWLSQLWSEVFDAYLQMWPQSQQGTKVSFRTTCHEIAA
jgi:hypothetical protein